MADEKNNRETRASKRERDEAGTSNQTGDLDRVTNMDTSLDSGLDEIEEQYDIDELDRAEDYEGDIRPETPGSSDLDGDAERGPESGRGGRT